LAAGQRATSVIKSRLDVFSKHGITRNKELSHACISHKTSASQSLSVLAAGSYCLVLARNRLLVGRAITVYSQNGGKSGAHLRQHNIQNIGLLSYAVVQGYENSMHTQFRSVLRSSASLQSSTFLHVPSEHFLWLLPGTQTLSVDGRSLDLNTEAWSIFRSLNANLGPLLTAVAELVKLKKKRQKRADVDRDSDREEE